MTRYERLDKQTDQGDGLHIKLKGLEIRSRASDKLWKQKSYLQEISTLDNP